MSKPQSIGTNKKKESNAAGSYKNLPVSSLERMLAVQETKMREAKFAHNTIKSNTSAVIKRKIKYDTKKYDAAFQETKKIESALTIARKREKKKHLPF